MFSLALPTNFKVDAPIDLSKIFDVRLVGKQGMTLGKYYEGCSLEAYPDPASGGDPWTIGYGDTGPDVYEGLVITQRDADWRFFKRMNLEFGEAVDSMVNVPITQDMFDALVDFAYNLGTDNLASSTLLRLLNSYDYGGASNEFPKWCNAGGQPMKGLQRRREAERLVFFGFDAMAAIQQAEATYP